MPELVATKRDEALPRNRGGRPAQISREQILDVAATFNLEELSMSAVAAQLGVTHASLYKYFPSKAALIAAVCAEASLQMDVPSPKGLAWSEWLVQAGLSCRDLMVRNLAGGSVLSSSLEAAAAPLLNAFVEVLYAEGFTPQETFDAYQLFIGCCLGGAIQARRMQDLQDGLARGDAYEPAAFLDGIGIAESSPVRDMFATLSQGFDIEQGFQRELQTVVFGLEHRRKERRRPLRKRNS